MKFVSVREFRTHPAEIWKKLAEGHLLVITKNGKPIAILVPTTEDDFEETYNMIREVRKQREAFEQKAKSPRPKKPRKKKNND